MSEATVVVTNPIKVDETAGVQAGDDEIPVLADWAAQRAALFGSDPVFDFAEPANLSYKSGMISTPQGATTVGWAENEAGDPVSGLTALDGDGNPLQALDPTSGNYETVTLNVDPTDDNILIGTTTSGNVAFIAVIVENPDGLSSDVYLLDYLPKEHLDDTNPDDTLSLSNLYVNVSVDESVEFDFEGAPSGNNVFMAFGQPGPEGVAIVVTGRFLGEDVNSSQAQNQPTSLAANSNNINAGEGLVVTYVNDMDPQYLVPGLTGPEAADANNIQFGTLQTANEASVTIVKVGPGSTTATVRLTAQFTADGTTADGSGGATQEEGTAFIPGIADDIEVPITEVYVNDIALTLGVGYTLDGNTAVITGIHTGDTITFVTVLDHNRFVVENGGTGNARFNIGSVAIEDINVVSDADPITLAFDDDGPTVAANATVLLDDDALSGGNPGGTGDDVDAANTSGTLQHSFGADGAGSIVWLTTGAPAGFSYALNGSDLEISQNGEVKLTLTVNATTGAYTVTQNNPIEHVAGNDENNQAFTVAYRVTDGDNDYTDGSIDINVDDDTPTVVVGDASGTYAAPAEATGTFVDGPGADGLADLAITFDSYQIDDNPLVPTSGAANVTFDETVTDTTWEGSIEADFNSDGTVETVEFTLDVDLVNDTYTVTLETPPAQTVELSTENGSLDAGGPDPVRTLTLADSSEVVFSAVVPTTAPGVISSFLNESEAYIEANALHLSDDEMNVSTAGIGNDNNNFDGNALSGIDGLTTQGGKVDESFVIDPTDFDVSSVKVYIDNAVGGYDNPPEELYYLAYDADGNAVGTPTLVTEAMLSPEAGGQVSFTIGNPEGPNNIDAVQLFMGTGTIKIPVIEFTVSTQFDPESLAMNFTATLEDGDVDTATDTFLVEFDPLV